MALDTAVGVPEITPVLELRLRPAGNAGLTVIRGHRARVTVRRQRRDRLVNDKCRWPRDSSSPLGAEVECCLRAHFRHHRLAARRTRSAAQPRLVRRTNCVPVKSWRLRSLFEVVWVSCQRFSCRAELLSAERRHSTSECGGSDAPSGSRRAMTRIVDEMEKKPPLTQVLGARQLTS